MDDFYALVVDDDKTLCGQARALERKNSKLHVTTARSLEEAEARIVDGFFHVALVDLQLVPRAMRDLGGSIVLNKLRLARPACRRVLLTQNSDEYRREVFELLEPGNPMIDSALDKLSFSQSFRHFLLSEAADWARAPVEIQGLDDAIAHIQKRGIKGQVVDDVPAVCTAAEIEYVLASVFGQRSVASDELHPPGPRTVQLRGVITSGKSRSVVMIFQPGTGDAQHGLLTVVKVGPLDDAKEELRRYDEFVRYRVSLHRRVELLGSALGDTVAAICYSFAGHAPDGITDLQTLFDNEDEDALRQIDTLFGPGAEDWLIGEHEGEDEGTFFNEAYGLDPDTVGKSLKRFAGKHAEKFGGRVIEDTIQFKGDKLVLPRTLGDARFRDAYHAAVVHGDMNASNVLVDGPDHVMLIDFRHAARGPRCLDFCALQGSLRLSVGALATANDRVAATHKLERMLWSASWAKDGADTIPNGQVLPYWARASRHLLEKAYNSLEGLEPHEHAVTALLYALRLFTAPKMKAEERFRLLVWIVALAEVIEDLAHPKALAR